MLGEDRWRGAGKSSTFAFPFRSTASLPLNTAEKTECARDGERLHRRLHRNPRRQPACRLPVATAAAAESIRIVCRAAQTMRAITTERPPPTPLDNARQMCRLICQYCPTFVLPIVHPFVRLSVDSCLGDAPEARIDDDFCTPRPSMHHNGSVSANYVKKGAGRGGGRALNTDRSGDRFAAGVVCEDRVQWLNFGKVGVTSRRIIIISA